MACAVAAKEGGQHAREAEKEKGERKGKEEERKKKGKGEYCGDNFGSAKSMATIR